MKRTVVFLMITGLTTMSIFGYNSERHDINVNNENQSSRHIEEFKVTGTVTDVKNGKPMPGVAVIIKGSNKGTVTDKDGRYIVHLPSNSILLFSFVGVDTKEIEIENRHVIDVIMGDETQSQTTFAPTLQLEELDCSNVERPLWIVDGKETEDIKSIIPENIESMTLIKDQSAIEEYGKKGKNGVVIITTKK